MFLHIAKACNHQAFKKSRALGKYFMKLNNISIYTFNHKISFSLNVKVITRATGLTLPDRLQETTAFDSYNQHITTLLKPVHIPSYPLAMTIETLDL